MTHEDDSTVRLLREAVTDLGERWAGGDMPARLLVGVRRRRYRRLLSGGVASLTILGVLAVGASTLLSGSEDALVAAPSPSKTTDPALFGRGESLECGADKRSSSLNVDYAPDTTAGHASATDAAHALADSSKMPRNNLTERVATGGLGQTVVEYVSDDGRVVAFAGVDRLDDNRWLAGNLTVCQSLYDSARSSPASSPAAAEPPPGVTTPAPAPTECAGATGDPPACTESLPTPGPEDARPGEPAIWNIDSERPPSPSARSFTVLVERLGCNNGETGQVLAAKVIEEDGQVVITFEVTQAISGRCPGNKPVRREVVLTAPLGDRVLLDGACSSGPAAGTSHCVDRGQRWPLRTAN